MEKFINHSKMEKSYFVKNNNKLLLAIELPRCYT
jgi:hypothetical protein